MKIDYKLVVCKDCQTAQKPHAEFHGKVYTHFDVAANKLPALPAECECHIEPVGNCHLCGLDAQLLREASTPQNAVSLRFTLTERETGQKIDQMVTFCGNCTLFAANEFIKLAQMGALNRIAAALQPKIITAPSIPIMDPRGNPIRRNGH